MTAGQVASFAPDYMKAKMAAGRILSLFDRTPAIDSYSDAGSKVCLYFLIVYSPSDLEVRHNNMEESVFY